MHSKMNTYDPQTGFVGFAVTGILFVLSHFIEAITSSITAQNLAYFATFCSGATNVFYLIRKNRRRKNEK